MVKKIVKHLDNDNQRIVSMCVLYHLSIDDKSKPMFTFTQCIDYVNHPTIFFFKKFLIKFNFFFTFVII